MIEALLVLTGIFFGAFFVRPFLERLFSSKEDFNYDDLLTDVELDHLIILLEETQKVQYHSISALCLKKLKNQFKERGYEKR